MGVQTALLPYLTYGLMEDHRHGGFSRGRFSPTAHGGLR